MDYAPVIIFAYNRPEFLKKTLESLHANDLSSESELFIFCDGPKAAAQQPELQKIDDVRKIAREKKWCKSVSIIEAEKNKGLANSVIDGVSQIIKKYGKVIVVEDDVLLSPYFLQFMNEALETYKNEEQVLSIGSWSYFAVPDKIKDETYFFRFPDSIAWATYERSWKLFELNANKLFKKLKEDGRIKNFNGGLKFPYFTNMLEAQINGKVNSWAIRWTALAVLLNKLTVFPAISLSKHIGFDADATHEKNSIDYNADLVLSNRKIKVERLKVEENPVAIEEWRKFYLTNFIPASSLNSSIRNTIRKMVPESFISIYRKLKSK
jgi:glycosyltransferase involved in cell wall biosynthesis